MQVMFISARVREDLNKVIAKQKLSSAHGCMWAPKVKTVLCFSLAVASWQTQHCACMGRRFISLLAASMIHCCLTAVSVSTVFINFTGWHDSLSEHQQATRYKNILVLCLFLPHVMDLIKLYKIQPIEEEFLKTFQNSK